MSRAALALTGPLDWCEEGEPAQAEPQALGDVVLARKEMPTSYHLAVTVDDAIQGVTLVTRGEDLVIATHIHRLLQALLGLPTPRYRHHPLLTDAAGRRLAKRDDAPTIRAMRETGMTPEQIIAAATRDRSPAKAGPILRLSTWLTWVPACAGRRSIQRAVQAGGDVGVFRVVGRGSARGAARNRGSPG